MFSRKKNLKQTWHFVPFHKCICVLITEICLFFGSHIYIWQQISEVCTNQLPWGAWKEELVRTPSRNETAGLMGLQVFFSMEEPVWTSTLASLRPQSFFFILFFLETIGMDRSKPRPPCYKASRSPANSPAPYLVHPLERWAFGDVSISVGVERKLALFKKHSQDILPCSSGVIFLSSGEQRGLQLCLKCSLAVFFP